ncbi:MFS transporter [Pseudaestuariivita rosea]|uniref:MFS transporter n=1 Tax=Pseudaestuariivita rosea TaxID=2763263 RepID=UPI001ABB0281|nr:MFS transporter [Pseudaestuariivita rosea]
MSVVTASSLTPQQRSLSLAAVIVSTVGVGISYGIGYPITALTFEQWGVPTWLNGLVGSAPALAILICLPFFPRLVGRLGTILAMALGCVLVGAGFLLMPLFQSPEAWLILRFIMGAGLALPWLVGETWINTVATDKTRGRMLALYSMALFSGFAIGPFVLDQVGITGWMPFLIGAGGILLAVVPIIMAAALAPRMPEHPETRIFGAVLLAPIAMIAGIVGGLLELGHFAMLPVYAIQSGYMEAEALRLLTVFMIGGIVLQFIVGWLADRMSARTVLIGSALLFALVAASLPIISDPWLRAAAVFVMGGLGIGFYTLGLTHIGQRVRVHDLAVANAAFLITYQIGAMVGPTVGGIAMSTWQPHGFVAAMSVAAVIGAIAMALVKHKSR